MDLNEPSTPTATAEGVPALRGRIIAPMQSAGRVGKSTFCELVLTWLTQAGVGWRALDCDPAHQTLSRRFPAQVPLHPVDSRERISELLSAIEPAPATILDFPAQQTEFLLSEFAHFRALEVFGEHGLRLTVPLFLLDDAAAEASLAAIVRRLGERADYLLVRNPAVRGSARVERSAMVERLQAAGAPTVEIPALTQAALSGVVRVQQAQKRFLSLNEAAPYLPLVQRFELESMLGRVYTQLDGVAHLLTPEPAAARGRATTRTGVGTNGVSAPEIDPLDPTA